MIGFYKPLEYITALKISKKLDRKKGVFYYFHQEEIRIKHIIHLRKKQVFPK